VAIRAKLRHIFLPGVLAYANVYIVWQQRQKRQRCPSGLLRR
jgi:hypothetical protein